MDGLVMGVTIPQEVHALHAGHRHRHGPDEDRCCWVVRKGIREHRNPQRREVRPGAEKSPEPERELRDNLALCLRLTATSGGSIARRADVGQCSLTVPARK
jgi:hypothetical protein